jgi:hypothetical protein
MNIRTLIWRKSQETEENFTLRKYVILFFTKYYSGDQINKDDLGRACSTYKKKKICRGIGSGNPKETDYFGDQFVDGG